jgi:hypothetical protein
MYMGRWEALDGERRARGIRRRRRGDEGATTNRARGQGWSACVNCMQVRGWAANDVPEGVCSLGCRFAVDVAAAMRGEMRCEFE